MSATNTTTGGVAMISETLLATLVAQAQQSGGAAVGQIVAAATPTLWAMGLADLARFRTALDARDAAKALSVLAEASSLDQLAAQKKTLADLTVQMATDNAATKAFWHDLAFKGLTTAVGCLVAI